MKRISIFMFIAILFAFACNTAEESPSENKNWSAFETLSVPYDLRKAELEKGNLVPNFSFEKGKAAENDSAITNFSIENWELIGENVEWVNADSEIYEPSEVSEGKYAIKISRKMEDVADLNPKSDGVLSDYIEVLPGNYLFFLDIKLKEVYPSVKRLNARLGTDIDIRLKFFDENKKEISPGVYYEYWDKEVDNSFKGFSFSNFYEIEDFGYGRIRGRTLNYPFSEGDMPDGCKYIKIFIGLKGRGTMWADNIEFKYSRWNFTPLERVKPFFEKEYHKSELLIPQAQHVSDASKIPVSDKSFAILLPQKPTNADYAAAELLKEQINKNFRKKGQNEQITVSMGSTPSVDDFIISVGNNELSDKQEFDTSKIQGKEQAFLIDKKENVFYLKGNTSIGNYYAATAFVQLFDADEQNIHFAKISDYPDFTGRSSKLVGSLSRFALESDTALSPQEREKKYQKALDRLTHQKELVDYYAFYRINKLYNQYHNLSKKWWEPGKMYEMMFDSAGERCKELGVINTCVQINPYFHFGYEVEEAKLSDSLRSLFSHSSPEGIDKIYQVIKKGLDRGANTIMMCADDFIPHRGKARGEYTLFTDADKKAYYNIAHAQNDMMNKLKKRIDANYDNIRYEFVPAPYLNQFIDYSKGSAEAFFRDLSSHLDTSFAVIWTGNTVRSLSYDHADIFRYTQHIKTKPMIWDNTPYARALEGEYGGYPAHYPGKAVMCNLFEPFDIVYPENFTELLDPHYYSNNGGLNELYKIQNAAFADFTWNTDDYNPDFSLFKILVYQYGREKALKLLEFNDFYFKFVSVWAEIRNGKENESEENPYNISGKQIKEGEKYYGKMQEKLQQLEDLQNKRLYKELKKKAEKKKEQFDELIKSDKVQDKEGRRQT